MTSVERYNKKNSQQSIGKKTDMNNNLLWKRLMTYYVLVLIYLRVNILL